MGWGTVGPRGWVPAPTREGDQACKATRCSLSACACGTGGPPPPRSLRSTARPSVLRGVRVRCHAGWVARVAGQSRQPRVFGDPRVHIPTVRRSAVHGPPAPPLPALPRPAQPHPPLSLSLLCSFLCVLGRRGHGVAGPWSGRVGLPQRGALPLCRETPPPVSRAPPRPRTPSTVPCRAPPRPP